MTTFLQIFLVWFVISFGGTILVATWIHFARHFRARAKDADSARTADLEYRPHGGRRSPRPIRYYGVRDAIERGILRKL